MAVFFWNYLIDNFYRFINNLYIYKIMSIYKKSNLYQYHVDLVKITVRFYNVKLVY